MPQVEFTHGDVNEPVYVETDNIAFYQARFAGAADKGTDIRFSDGLHLYVKETVADVKNKCHMARARAGKSE